VLALACQACYSNRFGTKHLRLDQQTRALAGESRNTPVRPAAAHGEGPPVPVVPGAFAPTNPDAGRLVEQGLEAGPVS
jgi:hypothetical protein